MAASSVDIVLDQGLNEAFDILIERFLAVRDDKLLHPVLYFHDLMIPGYVSKVSRPWVDLDFDLNI